VSPASPAALTPVLQKLCTVGHTIFDTADVNIVSDSWASTLLEHWGSQVERRRRENRGAVGGDGGRLGYWGLASGYAPSQKIYEFFISKWCDMVHSGCVVFKTHVSHGL